MLNEKRKYQDELANIMNNLAESVLDMSDEEIDEEIKEEGDNTEAVRQILLNSVKSCRQKSLHEARLRFETNSRLFQETRYDMPESPEEKRILIQAMLGNAAMQNQTGVTMQFRDFESLPDEDLDGILQQLYALKAIEDPAE